MFVNFASVRSPRNERASLQTGRRGRPINRKQRLGNRRALSPPPRAVAYARNVQFVRCFLSFPPVTTLISHCPRTCIVFQRMPWSVDRGIEWAGNTLVSGNKRGRTTALQRGQAVFYTTIKYVSQRATRVSLRDEDPPVHAPEQQTNRARTRSLCPDKPPFFLFFSFPFFFTPVYPEVVLRASDRPSGSSSLCFVSVGHSELVLSAVFPASIPKPPFFSLLVIRMFRCFSSLIFIFFFPLKFFALCFFSFLFFFRGRRRRGNIVVLMRVGKREFEKIIIFY